ncbi:uncharacterized protein LOC124151308 [Haliotis rufescens]|uniref:uncharacterized protein LOC124151308 n=1 Tax=Haliotis rufescens TaxID=6454 RepID=UPI00201FB2F7|nr:uncharacterized protein LOC124151308 [Haliotis rufescens]XP_048249004.1 uncharacterized protein LOC124151308 [Haliotis rufescens]
MTGTYKGYITVIVSVLMIWTVMEYAASNYWTRTDTNDFIVPAKHPGVDHSVSAESPRCPDVKTGMMRGRWTPRTLTAQEKVDIDTFLQSARSSHGLPKSMQRRDGKCGNVAYENLHYFRALCNPEGATPCCYGDTCINKTPDDCKCPSCFDLRNEIYAEYSTWEPEDSRCQVKNFTAQQACDLLQGLTLAFVGDSLMRHVYTAMLMVLSNSTALNPDKDSHVQCNGMYAFSDKICRANIKRQATFCGGSVTLKMLEYFHLEDAAKFHADFHSFLNQNKTVVLVGVGCHDNFNFERVFNEYIYPVIDMMKKNKALWPKVIWSANHKFGLLKSPKIPLQDNSHVASFNRLMSEGLGKYAIPIFDTYNLTSGVMSTDGGHFGIGVNVMKVQMLLNYLLELKSNW